MFESIQIFRTAQGWMSKVRFEDGTAATMPTAFTAQADGQEVLETLRTLNPDCPVTFAFNYCHTGVV